MGESEEAGRRTLSSHGPENHEEKEIALSLNKWVPLALGPASEQNKSVSAASSTSWTTWGLAGMRGGGAPLSCERLDAPA